MVHNASMPGEQISATSPKGGDKRIKMLDAAMRRQQFQADALLEVLHSAQELYGFLSQEVLLHIGRSLKVPPSRVYGVATFYNHFSLKPKGEHTCTVCMGTACYVKGAGEILGALQRGSYSSPPIGPPPPTGRSRWWWPAASVPAGSHRPWCSIRR